MSDFFYRTVYNIIGKQVNLQCLTFQGFTTHEGLTLSD